jgi:radical SAM protein with 4Fe4S-binding SPASM domain
VRYNYFSLIKNRHYFVVKNHLTVRKLLNIFFIFSFRFFKISKGFFKPIFIKIETTDCCNLKCQYCHDGSVYRHNKFLNFEFYKNIVDTYKKTLLEVSLYDQGEPLIDPNICSYIEYANKNNIGTVISTNLSMDLPYEKIVTVVTSGLDYMQIAIDGITQSTYEIYRKGGNLEKVLCNLKTIIAIKKKFNMRTPVIEWQMIDFEFNRHEQKQAKDLASELGVDRFNIKPDCYGSYPDIDYCRENRCLLLWSSFAVECNGFVSACLIKDDDSLYVGDLNQNSIAEIWHSEKFRNLRRFSIKKNDGYYCRSCNKIDGRVGRKSEKKDNYSRLWLTRT